MSLYVVPIAQPAIGTDWTATVPGQYLWDVTGITATLATGAGNPATAIDYSGNGFDGAYQNNLFHAILYVQPGLIVGDTCVTNVSPTSNDPVAIAPTALAPMTQGFAVNIWESPLPGVIQRTLAALEDTPTGSGVSYTIQSTGGGNYTCGLQWFSTHGFGNALQNGAISAGAHMFSVELDVGAATVQFYVDGAAFGAPHAITVATLPDDVDVFRFGAAANGTVTVDEPSLVDGAPGAGFWASLYAARGNFATYDALQLGNAPINYYHLDETPTGATGRQVDLVVTDGTHEVLEIPTGFAESLTSGAFAYSWQPNLNSSTQTPDQLTTTIAIPRLILPAGYTIGARTLDLGAQDQWSNVVIWWDDGYQQGTVNFEDYGYAPGYYTYQRQGS